MPRNFPFDDPRYNGFPYQSFPYTSFPFGDPDVGEGRSTSRSRSGQGSADRSSGSIILTIVAITWFAIWLSIRIIRLVFWLSRIIIRQVKKRDPKLGSLSK